MEFPKIKSNFDLIRADVVFTVPNGKKWAGVGYLRSDAVKGLKVFNFEGYTVIEEQLLIGISPAYAKSEGETVANLIAMVLADLYASTGKKYMLVSDKQASSAQTGGHWFWAATATTLSRMHKAAPGGHLSILTWGLA